MGAPMVVFVDPVRAIIDYLTPAVDASANFPDERLTGEFRIQVALDGSGVADYPVTERATVRVTLWMPPEYRTVPELADSYIQALLVAHPGDEHVWSVQPLTGRLPGTDPDTGNQFITFTVRVNLRPQIGA